jgi:hypothetical protein
MTHLAVQQAEGGAVVEWRDLVAGEYPALTAATGRASSPGMAVIAIFRQAVPGAAWVRSCRDGREGCDGARFRRFADRHEQAAPGADA